MKSFYIVLPILCAAPLLHSCTSLTTTLAGYGVKSVVNVQHSAETPDMHYDLGRYYQAQSRWDSAARAYERALALRKDYVEAASALATCYAMQGQYDRAISLLEDAVGRAPGQAYLHNNLGYVYYLHGSYPKAIAALEAATRLEPENGRAWRNLALAHGKAGAPEQARDAYARANRATPRTLLENWRAAHPVSTEARNTATARSGAEAAKAPDLPSTSAATPSTTPRVAALAGSAATPEADARTTATMEVVPVAGSIYELRPLKPATAPAPVGVALAQNLLPPSQSRASVRAFRVEVSNGNGTTGMARRVARSLKDAGMNTVRLTNQMPWQHASEIQFSEGYALEAAKLAGLLGHELLTVRNDRLRRDIHVRLVLGKDVRNETAFVTPRDGAGSTKVASVK